MNIQFLGHACLYISIKGVNILIDPFITGNSKASHINLDEINPNFILLTHAHQDHILDVEFFAKKNNSVIVSNWEIATYYSNKGFQSHPMNHGGSWQFNFGKVIYTNAVHSSSFPDGSYGGQPGGFIIQSEHKTIYIAGDTALTFDMKLIPLKHQLDLAVLPIGDNFTMGVEDALVASDFVSCDKILGYHFDTFGFIEINHEAAIQTFFKAGKDLMLLNIGESIDI
jgi:L-ascorbate metabolism protein UlaG (beta-lactamase superfamily)